MYAFDREESVGLISTRQEYLSSKLEKNNHSEFSNRKPNTSEQESQKEKKLFPTDHQIIYVRPALDCLVSYGSKGHHRIADENGHSAGFLSLQKS